MPAVGRLWPSDDDGGDGTDEDVMSSCCQNDEDFHHLDDLDEVDDGEFSVQIIYIFWLYAQA